MWVRQQTNWAIDQLINGSVGLLPDSHSEGPGFDSQPWQFIICIYFHVLLHDLFHNYYYYYYQPKVQTPTDRAKCHKPEGTSKEGSPKKEEINRNEGKKDKNTI